MIRVTYETPPDGLPTVKDFPGDRWESDSDQVVVMKNDEPIAMIATRRVVSVEMIESESSA